MHLKITGLIVCLLLLNGCSKPVSEYQNLSEKPPVSITPYNTPIDESIISTRLSIPLNDLRKRLEADIPVSLYNDPGAVKEKCIRIFGKNLCESYQVGGSVQRTGSVQLTPLNNGVLRIAVPLQYKLEAKGNGKIVRELLRNIDFKTAAFTAIADLKLNVNSQWQFQLDAKSSLKWNQSPKIRVLGVELDIQSKVEKPILKALDKVLKKQQSKMAANTSLKDRVEKFWLSLQQPRKLNGPFQLWVKANPKTLSLSTIDVSNDAIQIAISLLTTLTTSDDLKSFKTQPIPLQPLNNRVVQASSISLSLPLSLAYEDLAKSMQQRLDNKPLEYKQGKTSIAVKSIEIYPNNDRLVLAAEVELSGLADFLTSGGEVYISGKPVVDNQNKLLKLTDVEFSQKLDSIFWGTATNLLHEQLLSGLKEALVYDFSTDYAALRQTINEQLQSQQSNNLSLDGQLDSLEIQHIHPDANALRLILKARGLIDLQLTTL